MRGVGNGDPKVRPVVISGIPLVKQILSELRTRYDHVILDGSPVLTEAGDNLLCSLADEVTIAIRANFGEWK